MKYNEKTTYVKKEFKGNIIDVETLGVELIDGSTSTREIIRHPGASVIIAINENNEIYFVRQFRKPIENDLLELPAGKLDFKGEDPLKCAKRELKEETGLSANEIKYVTSIYSAPGIMDEVLHFYLAKGLSQGEASPDEGEFLNVEKYKINDVIEMITNRKIKDSKTVIGVLLIEKYINNKFSI
jgi:ADP-ribose pyrophosphatase